MIRLFKVKEQQRAENTHGTTGVKKQSTGELHLHKGKPYYVCKTISAVSCIVWKLLGTVVSGSPYALELWMRFPEKVDDDQESG